MRLPPDDRISAAAIAAVPRAGAPEREQVRLELQVPELVGLNGSTHFWFPSGARVVLDADTVVIDVRLADDCSERRIVQRVSIRGSSPMNHEGKQFSLTHRVAAAGAGLF